jgi:1,4-alpha-glucan branching enzyme
MKLSNNEGEDQIMNTLYVSLVLHAHLPYVRKNRPHLEERWLFEAITECYIPLIHMLDTNEHLGNWTISFSPPLMEMLTDSIMQERYIQYIQNTERLIEEEKRRTTDEIEKKLINFYEERIKLVKQTFFKWNKDVISAFRHYYQKGKIECMTTSASHAILPYLKTPQGVRAQIVHGIKCFEKHFYERPKGFWLPECAIAPEIVQILQEEGILYTIIEPHALENVEEEPIYSTNGVVLFPRHQAFSRKIWDASIGYPGDYDYREFYRDIAFEREWEYLAPHLETNVRVDTGLKYYRITGKTDHKEHYVRERAKAKVQLHSKDFVETLETYLKKRQNQSTISNHVVLAFDAELFGHWWFEGPEWLELLLTSNPHNIDFLTPSTYIRKHGQALKSAKVSFSTWGRNGFGDTWLNEKNAWIYRVMHKVEKDLIHCIATYQTANRLQERVLLQMTREWFLLTASDWAFMIDRGNYENYAIQRINDHVQRFDLLKEMLKSHTISEKLLLEIEEEYSFLKEMDLTIFLDENDQKLTQYKKSNCNCLKILMLTWEYPPFIVGGLARHVFDLSKELAKIGHDVFVLTTFIEGQPIYEQMNGVHVFRVQGLMKNSKNFLQWVFSLNLALAEQGMTLSRFVDFDLIHAHDWLVGPASLQLKKDLNIPLIATIHATEHGRSDGIHTQLQQEIHLKESELVNGADGIIVCSEYMKHEVMTVFKTDPRKISVLPNGVDPELLMMEKEENKILKQLIKESDRLILAMGRMVREKGFDTLIEAAPLILQYYPSVKFVIAGQGPMLEKYRKIVHEKQLETAIFFIGLVGDAERNELLKKSDIFVIPSLYEPFGIVTLEAMVCAKPVVASFTGGLKEIVEHNRTGLFMNPGDSQSLAEQVTFLLQHPDVAERFGKEAQKTVLKKYRWENIAKDTIFIFRKHLETWKARA